MSACLILLLTLFAGLLAVSPAEAQTFTLSGTLHLEGVTTFSPRVNHVPFNFEFCSATGASAGTAFVRTASLNSDFTYSIPNIPQGTYSVSIKGYKWLRHAAATSQSFTGDTALSSVTLSGGDANNDNVVDINDFGILLNAYGLTETDYGFDDHADFTCDGVVNIGDFGLLVNNYTGTGQAYQITLDPPTNPYPAYYPVAGVVHLHWSWSGAPSGVTYNIYRSLPGSAAHSSTPITSPVSGTSFDDGAAPMTPVAAGTYYYQIAAYDSTHNVCALSNEIAVTVVQGVTVANTAATNTCTMTGYQADNATPIYQAQIANGLLKSFITYSDSDVTGAHGQYLCQGTTYPFQFGETTAFSANGVTYPNLFTHSVSTGTVGAQHTFLSLTPQPAVLGTDAVQFQVQEAYGSNTSAITNLTYEAFPTRLEVTLQPNFPTSVAWQMNRTLAPASDGGYGYLGDVLAVQPREEPAQQHSRLPGSGVIYALPLVATEGTGTQFQSDRNYLWGIPATRNYLKNGAVLDIENINPDGANQASLGEIFNYYAGDQFYSFDGHLTCWGRDFTSSFIRFAFTIPTPRPEDVTVTESALPAARLVALSGTPYTGAGGTIPSYTNDILRVGSTWPTYSARGMFARNAPDGNTNLAFRLLFDSLAGSQLDALSDPGTLYYRITGFWGEQVASGMVSLPKQTGTGIAHGFAFYPTSGSGNPSFYYRDFTIPMPTALDGTPMTGWFHITAGLVNGGTGKNPLHADDVEFGIYNYHADPTASATKPYLYNAAISDDVSQLMGLRSLRISTNYIPPVRDAMGMIIVAGHYDPAINTSVSPVTPNVAAFMQLNALGNPFNQNYADPNAILLFGSCVEYGNLGGTASTNSDYLYPYNVDVANFVQAYGNPSHAPYGGTAHGTPFTAWSLDNEPEDKEGYQTVAQIKSYIENKLAYGYQLGVHSVLGTDNGIALGPNVVSLTYPTKDDKTYRLDWLDHFLNTSHTGLYSSGADWVDGFGIHTYTGNYRSWEEQGVYEDLQYLHWLLTQKGEDKPIWITEHSWPGQWHGDMPRLQAAYTIRKYAMAAAQGIPHEHNSYFAPYFNGSDYNYELFEDYNNAPNRAGMAYRVLAEQTQGLSAFHYDAAGHLVSHDLLLNNPAAKYVHAIAYTDQPLHTITPPPSNNGNTGNEGGSDPAVVVVWGDDFLDPHQAGYTAAEGVALTFTVQRNDVTVYDIMGNSLGLTPMQNGTGASATFTYTIPATSSPVYVHLTNDELWYLETTSNHAIGGWPIFQNETNYAAASQHGVAQVYDLSTTGVLTLDDPYLYSDGQYVDDSYSFLMRSGGVSALNDGVWQYDNGETHKVTDRQTTHLVSRDPWISQLCFIPTGDPLAAPTYVVAEVDFTDGSAAQNPVTHLIDTVIAVCPSNNNDGVTYYNPALNIADQKADATTLCGIRDYDIQVWQVGAAVDKATGNAVGSFNGSHWETLKSVQKNETEWVLHANLPTQRIPAQKVRIVIKDVNNGRWYDDKRPMPYFDATGALGLQYGSSLHAALYEIEAYGTQ